jgi:succinyl-CoA synthetase beta subunit
MKKLALILITAFVGLALVGGYSRAVSADAASDVCAGIGTVNGDPANCDQPKGGGSVQNAITVAVNILSWVVGIAAVFVVIVGGFRYITSGGDSTKVGSAKNAILYAVVGLVVVAMAQVIVRFTLKKTGA